MLRFYNQTDEMLSLLLSFIPSLAPLFAARLFDQVIRGGGKEFHIGKEWLWGGNLWETEHLSFAYSARFKHLICRFKFASFTFLVEEEKARSMRGGHVL